MQIKVIKREKGNYGILVCYLFIIIFGCVAPGCSAESNAKN
jgi:hypothetical protein